MLLLGGAFAGAILLHKEKERKMEIKHKNTGAVLFSVPEADLRNANLQNANFRNANLQNADLQNANLQNADLWGANLRNANLQNANLQNANLWGANLRNADLWGANLEKTCLDPNNIPNADVSDFKEVDDAYVFGYRLRTSPIAGKFLVNDRIYGCEVFSTADTECHPGWYLWPSYQAAFDWNRDEIIKVKARIIDIHKAGNKWRARTIHVLSTVTE